MNQIQKDLLEQIAGIHEVPAGAYNIRMNGESAGRNTTENIDIVTKDDKKGASIGVTPFVRSFLKKSSSRIGARMPTEIAIIQGSIVSSRVISSSPAELSVRIFQK